jgi:hypothetical protein
MNALLLIAVLVAGLRMAGAVNPAFQAAAHLFVGGLAGAWVVRRYLRLAMLISGLFLVEVVCFLYGVGR